MGMIHDSEVMRRLAVTEGHLAGVLKMASQGASCREMLHQLHAVQAALAQVEQGILERHLKRCLRESLEDSTRGPRALEEALELVTIALGPRPWRRRRIRVGA